MMTRREATRAILAGTALAAAPAGVAQSAKVVLLPPPQITGGKPLVDALEARRPQPIHYRPTCRRISARKQAFRTSSPRRRSIWCMSRTVSA